MQVNQVLFRKTAIICYNLMCKPIYSSKVEIMMDGTEQIGVISNALSTVQGIQKQLRDVERDLQKLYFQTRRDHTLPEVMGEQYLCLTHGLESQFEDDEPFYYQAVAYHNPDNDTWSGWVDLFVAGGFGISDPYVVRHGFLTSDEAIKFANKSAKQLHLSENDN